jgi:RecJ-like exonuclease
VADKNPFWRRLIAPATALDAAELQHQAEDVHANKCNALRRGDNVVVQGRLRQVVYTPREAVPTVEAELFDGNGSLSLVWLGRRRIPGIEPGRTLRVEGCVGVHDGHPAIYNPRYELRAHV